MQGPHRKLRGCGEPRAGREAGEGLSRSPPAAQEPSLQFAPWAPPHSGGLQGAPCHLQTQPPPLSQMSRAEGEAGPCGEKPVSCAGTRGSAWARKGAPTGCGHPRLGGQDRGRWQQEQEQREPEREAPPCGGERNARVSSAFKAPAKSTRIPGIRALGSQLTAHGAGGAAHGAGRGRRLRLLAGLRHCPGLGPPPPNTHPTTPIPRLHPRPSLQLSPLQPPVYFLFSRSVH